MNLQITNGTILTPYRRLKNKCLRISDGRINSIVEETDCDRSQRTIDACGGYISPGFVDIHLHGGGGFDFMDCSEEALLVPAEQHARHGTTSMAPTTTACSVERLREFIAIYESVNTDEPRNGADFLGIHIEGPYFADSQKGAQDSRHITAPIPEEYMSILGSTDKIIRWDSAPELRGSHDFGDTLLAAGILPSIAHSDATFEESMKALEHGFSHVTHFYSGTSSVTRRDAFRTAGIVEFGYLRDEVTVEIIADGFHLPANLLSLIYKIKGPSRTALITDAMRATGTDATRSKIGDATTGLDVIIEDGVAKLPDRTSFAGSVATADRLVKNMVDLVGVPIEVAVQMMTITPAKIVGFGSCKGVLAPGYDGDVVVFDENLRILATVVKGRVVYERK